MSQHISEQEEGNLQEVVKSLTAAILPFCIREDANEETLSRALVPLMGGWSRDPGDGPVASALGRGLVDAGCLDTETLQHALPVLGEYLQHVLAGAGYQEIHRLLGAVSAGYAAALQERTLEHQEQLHQALRESRDAAQSALEEEMRFVNAVLDHIEALIIVSTAEGVITRFNQAAERVTGYTLEEIASSTGAGRPLVTEETQPQVMEVLAKLRGGPDAPRALPVRTAVRTRSGEERIVDWIFTLLFDESGEFSHYVVSGIDSTANVQIEAELQEVRRLLAERENAMQRSLARSLHDGPVQELLSLGHAVSDMQKRAEAEEPWTPRQRLEELIPALDIVRRKLLSVATGLRQLIAEMRPPGLEEMGLRQAVEAFLHEQSVTQDLPWPEVSIDIPENVDALQEPARTTLYLLIREALRNIHHHAQASSVAILVRLEDDVAHVMVHDDGRGFRVPDRLSRLVRRQQYGLVGMQERVQLRGGSMVIDSQPGQGTTIRISLPVQLGGRG